MRIEDRIRQVTKELKRKEEHTLPVERETADSPGKENMKPETKKLTVANVKVGSSPGQVAKTELEQQRWSESLKNLEDRKFEERLKQAEVKHFMKVAKGLSK